MMKRNDRGFTLLLAVLISGVTLSIGIAIFNITFKEIRLSSAGRESQFAFYAADSGAECALFHDWRNEAFGSGAASSFNITCADDSLEVTKTDVSATIDEFDFRMILDQVNSRYCADVKVRKEEVSTDVIKTTVISRGTNVCVVQSNRRVERAIELVY